MSTRRSFLRGMLAAPLAAPVIAKAVAVPAVVAPAPVAVPVVNDFARATMADVRRFSGVTISCVDMMQFQSVPFEIDGDHRPLRLSCGEGEYDDENKDPEDSEWPDDWWDDDDED